MLTTCLTSPFRKKFQLLMAVIPIVCFFIYAPMAWRETELYWNPDTGNFDLHGTYATWSLSVAMLSAFAIILPANIALLLKIQKEQRYRHALHGESQKTSKNEVTIITKSTVAELCATVLITVPIEPNEVPKRRESSWSADDNTETGCMPRILMPKIDIKMTFVLIGISLAFIVLTIPHRILVVYATLKEMTIAELEVAVTRQFCHINFACNSIFYFFLASECRHELKKTCCCCKKWYQNTLKYMNCSQKSAFKCACRDQLLCCKKKGVSMAATTPVQTTRLSHS